MARRSRLAGLRAEARHFDGRSARPRPVVLSLGARSLLVLSPDGQALAHWPLASLRAAGDRGDATLQLLPGPDSDERVVVEDPRMVDALRESCPDLHRRRVDRRGLRRVVLWSGAAAAAVALVVFVVVPALAERLALMIPPEREVALGEAVVEQLQDVLGWLAGEPPEACVEPEGVAALQRMAERIDPGADLPYPLRVTVLDHDWVNAVAVPGGRVVLFRGLIGAAGSPEEVAGVLAHEVAHVVGRDPTRGVLRSAGTAGIFGLLLGDVFGATIVVAATEAVLNASYSREAERQADETAFRLLNRAELPVAPFAGFFERLAGEQGDDSEGILRYLASHPGFADRAERAAAADRIGDGPYLPVLDDRGWVALQGICSETSAELP